ncbi:hypothetical protein [Rosistilla oblonga]|uniref:hypothetical protein n=1 Tax=Rosistilla oblonga TaxID=2527990 RepID=UPI003A980A54
MLCALTSQFADRDHCLRGGHFTGQPRAMIQGYSERDICTKLITPALLAGGWQQDQFREEVNLTAGRVIVSGNQSTRRKGRDEADGPTFADYALHANPQPPLAVFEVKKNYFPMVSEPGRS